jgi:hypothetical protein
MAVPDRKSRSLKLRRKFEFHARKKIALPSQNGMNANKKALYEYNAEFSNVISGGKYVYR